MNTPTAASLALLSVLVVRPQQGQADPAPQQEGLIPPEVRIRSEDFVAARAAFQTKLVHTGPAPAKASLPATPAGVRAIEFPSAGQQGELHLTGWLQQPEGSEGERSPAVVFLHGGFAFGREDWQMAQPFRDAGYVVLAPMLRGENGQAGAYTLFYDEVDDVLAAGRWLAAQDFVDRKRVYVAGHSVGGTLALLAAMSTKDFAAAVSFSGSPDQVIYCRVGIAPEQIPFDASNPRELELRSPLAFATSFRCPVRLYFGTDEPHFRLSSERTAQLARAAKLDVQASAIEGGHEGAVPAAMEQAIAFFEEH